MNNKVELGSIESIKNRISHKIKRLNSFSKLVDSLDDENIPMSVRTAITSELENELSIQIDDKSQHSSSKKTKTRKKSTRTSNKAQTFTAYQLTKMFDMSPATLYKIVGEMGNGAKSFKSSKNPSRYDGDIIIPQMKKYWETRNRSVASNKSRIDRAKKWMSKRS